ncbi:MAG: hypothetical protein JWP97_6118 [Labilithrix sp.]|nr:hypothetical protein [Labilithrix sp.]
MIVATLLASGVAAAACSTLVGVEDVRYRSTRDGALDSPTVDEEEGGSDGGADSAVLPEAGVQVAVGFLHACARTGGRVKCWGGDTNGQLGDGVDPPGPDRKTPQDVVSVSDAVFLASGNSHSCVARASGKVSCWGSNSFGQLGDATEVDSPRPVDAIGVNDAVTVSCGSSFTCAVLRSGQVSCWGTNDEGQLGDGTTISRTTPSPVLQLTGAVGVTAAQNHACATLGDGAVKCWGANEDGQLGNGTTTASLLPTSTALASAAQVAAASQFTCARAAGGQVSCWGSNHVGQLGTGSANPAPNPSPAISSVKDAIALATGYQHACAARRTGEVMCWGAAGQGQIGSAMMYSSDAAVPRPTTVVGVTGALDVSAGGDQACAVNAAGAVFCWGNNAFGQLGNGTEEPSYAAVRVTGYP